MVHGSMSKIEQLPFSELQAVVAVAEHRSFRRASRALGVSPSALSHAVANVERRLRVLLFHRTTRSVAPTEAGQRLVVRVRPALRELTEAMETANESRDKPTGTLRINAAAAGARRVFVPVILPFLERYPDMHVDLVTEGRLVDIVAEGFDAGIRLAEMVPRDMVAIPCSPPMRFVVVGAPRYLERRGTPKTVTDLQAHTCIRRRMPSGAPLRWELGKGAKAVNVDVHGPLTLDSDELVVAAVAAGVGLGWVNEWSVESLVAKGKLVTVLDDWSLPFPGLALYYPTHRHVSAGLRALVDLVRVLTAGASPHRSRGTTSSRSSRSRTSR
jgi:DNA-binding transcriptional LysR family regulator